MGNNQNQSSCRNNLTRLSAGDVEERKSLLQCFFSPWGVVHWNLSSDLWTPSPLLPKTVLSTCHPLLAWHPFFACQFCNAKSIPWSELLVKDCTRAKLLPLSLHSLYNEHYSLPKLHRFSSWFCSNFLSASCLCELLFLSSLWSNIIWLKRAMKWCCFLLRSSSGKWATFVKLSLCCQTSISHSEASEPWAVSSQQ